MIWAGHITPMEEKREVYRISVGAVKERGHLEDVGTDRRKDFK